MYANLYGFPFFGNLLLCGNINISDKIQTNLVCCCRCLLKNEKRTKSSNNNNNNNELEYYHILSEIKKIKLYVCRSWNRRILVQSKYRWNIERKEEKKIIVAVTWNGDDVDNASTMLILLNVGIVLGWLCIQMYICNRSYIWISLSHTLCMPCIDLHTLV